MNRTKLTEHVMAQTGETRQQVEARLDKEARAGRITRGSRTGRWDPKEVNKHADRGGRL